jgi:hypothetical protein
MRIHRLGDQEPAWSESRAAEQQEPLQIVGRQVLNHLCREHC